MKFVQVISFTSDTPAEELVAVEDGWRQATLGRRANVIEWFLVDRSDPRRKFAINGFPDHESAMVNSKLPETDALSKEIGTHIDGDVTFTDCDLVDQAAGERQRLIDGLATAMSTTKVPPDVFADDVFFDMNVPAWRYQLQGIDTVRNMLAVDVVPSEIISMHASPTFDGFILEIALRDPQEMFRQVFLVKTRGGLISEVTLYCTGPWDAATEARQRVEAPMIRPD